MTQGCGDFYVLEPTSVSARDICIFINHQSTQEEHQGSGKALNGEEYIARECLYVDQGEGLSE
jgi:hypothetical protein